MKRGMTYAEAGVDIEAGDRLAGKFAAEMRRTFGPRVIRNEGGFAGLLSLDYDRKLFAKNYKHPVLVASTDGVGTKLEVAQLAGQHRGVGVDLVAMCVNDIVVQGATPLFFLDYVATGKVEGETLLEVVKGVADGCEEAGCALLGGETAEMPGFYKGGQYDLAGFVVGVVEKDRVVDGSRMEPGDVVLGLESSGVHSNGYSLVRQALLGDGKKALGGHEERLGRTLGEELLAPTRIYVRSVLKLLAGYKVKRVVRALAHITGGGIAGNLVRVLGPGCTAEIFKGRWPVQPIFGLIQEAGGVEEEEMYRVFNMGIGMVAVVAPHFAAAAARSLTRSGEKVHVIGRIVRGKNEVALVEG